MDSNQYTRFNEHLEPHASRLQDLGSIVREDSLPGHNIVRLYALDDNPIEPVINEFIAFLRLTLGSGAINHLGLGHGRDIVIGGNSYNGLVVEGEKVESPQELMQTLLFGTYTVEKSRHVIHGRGSSSYGKMASMYRVFCPTIDCVRRDEMNDFLTAYKAEMVRRTP
ncbi:hypothetical protein HYX06_02010 [Candidatus Woesearchaeota archaeon]|nr:hypothetical protein [Candidatus Woesearchaeota archaeon]